jgi:hypothetical protein
MAYQGYYYATDPEKVKAVFGSKDKALLENLKQNKCYLAHDRQINVFKHLMIDIIMHYEHSNATPKKRFGLFPVKQKEAAGLSPRYAETYGFALEALCDFYGDELDCPEEIFNYGKHWDQADRLLNEWGAHVFLNKTTIPSELFDIPKIKKFPVINVYQLDELKSLNEVLNKNANQFTEAPKTEKSLQLLKSFHQHVQHSLKCERPMISFLY